MQLQQKSKLNSFHVPRGRLSLLIFVLALCVGVQAVGAKSSHYSPSSTQSRYFSASVKIAKFIPLEVVALQVGVIPVAPFSLQEPQFESVLPVLEYTPAETAPPASALLLRSPPRNS
jgi:hypothetical protein